MILEREFMRLGDNVYKIGRTDNVKRRLAQYPKGSRLLFSIYTPDCLTAERELIRHFKGAYKHREDIGREYFQGESHCMINVITEYVTAQLRNTVVIDTDSDSMEVVAAKQDVSLVLMEYVTENGDALSGQHVRSRVLLEGFMLWLKDRRYVVSITHSKLVRELNRLYGAKDSTHYFDDEFGVGVEHCVSFPYFLARAPAPAPATLPFVAPTSVTPTYVVTHTAAPTAVPAFTVPLVEPTAPATVVAPVVAHTPAVPTGRLEFESLLRRCRYVASVGK